MLTDNMLNPGEHTKCKPKLIDAGTTEKKNSQVPLEHTNQETITGDQYIIRVMISFVIKISLSVCPVLLGSEHELIIIVMAHHTREGLQISIKHIDNHTHISAFSQQVFLCALQCKRLSTAFKQEIDQLASIKLLYAYIQYSSCSAFS